MQSWISDPQRSSGRPDGVWLQLHLALGGTEVRSREGPVGREHLCEPLLESEMSAPSKIHPKNSWLGSNNKNKIFLRFALCGRAWARLWACWVPPGHSAAQFFLLLWIALKFLDGSLKNPRAGVGWGGDTWPGSITQQGPPRASLLHSRRSACCSAISDPAGQVSHPVINLYTTTAGEGVFHVPV